jgi:uncharacterized FlaG/YvyC family protein
MEDVSLRIYNTGSSHNSTIEKTTQSMNEIEVNATQEGQVTKKHYSFFENGKYDNEKEREKLKNDANKLFESLNTGLALKFHEKSGLWYAVIENKITHEVIKEVPPKDVLELRARLKEMIGFFLDQKM